VASSRFALYTAELDQLSGKDHVQFTPLPLSEHIQGESLLDVSLRCGSSGPCHAAVLHGLGQRLSTFPLDASSLDATSGGLGKTNGEAFLQDGTVLDESAVALAISSQCQGRAHDCAYVGTSENRIVEMQRTRDGRREWFRHRLLRPWTASSGSMGLIQDRYLGVLHSDGQRFQVIDLHKDDGVVSSWQLPETSDGRAFGAMCAAGDNLYFLSKGYSPQIWRFALPEHLLSNVAHNEKRDSEVGVKGNEKDSEKDMDVLLVEKSSHASPLDHKVRAHKWT